MQWNWQIFIYHRKFIQVYRQQESRVTRLIRILFSWLSQLHKHFVNNGNNMVSVDLIFLHRTQQMKGSWLRLQLHSKKKGIKK